MDFEVQSWNGSRTFKEIKQFIEQGTIRSKLCEVTCGVPQGSNLGPLLFLLYINDLPDCLQYGKSILFADDTTTYQFGKNGAELTERMNVDSDKLANWFKANKLTLNVFKTYSCEFHDRRSCVIGELTMQGQVIERSDSVKYLGLHVDNKLTWKNHIAHVTNKINQVIGVMAKIRNHLTKEAMKTIYYALVHSRLVYGIEIWGTAYATTIKPLEIAQKKAIRIIAGVGYREHTEPLFQDLEIRPLRQEIEFRRALLAYDIQKRSNEYGYAIEFTNEHQHQYSTRFVTNRNLPVIRKKTEKFGTMGLQSLLLASFNKLPERIKETTWSLKTAKKNIGLIFR